MFSRGFETFISCVSMGAMSLVEFQNITPEHIYNPIMAMGFSAMFTFQRLPEVNIAGTP